MVSIRKSKHAYSLWKNVTSVANMRKKCLHSAIYSDDYKQFLQQPSGNMDDTGYFSVQVITKALALWNLDLIPLNSTDTISTNIRQNPTHAQAFIFNMDNHWFCIRRFRCIGLDDVPDSGQSGQSGSAGLNTSRGSTDSSGNTSQGELKAFFNLDSLLSRPSYMSGSYLTEYLRQMQSDGYSIFVISGMFPECSAEPLLMLSTDVEPSAYIDLTRDQPKENVKPNANIQSATTTKAAATAATPSENVKKEPLPEWAFRNRQLGGASTSKSTDDENADLEAALRLSLECFGNRTADTETTDPPTTDGDSAALARLRDKRLAYFDAMGSNTK